MPKVTGLGHVGIYVHDPQLMIEFYSGFLGMSVTDRGPDDGIVFLSANPAIEHHEFAMVRSVDHKTDPQQISFTVASLADLRSFYAGKLDRGYPVEMVVNHGNAIGCYFRDPEQNVVEVYWHTGKDWPQPYGDPIDLSKSEEELLDIVAAL
ncbi:MAG: VOC family protein [Streptosporangiaceae bacterium]